MAIYSMKTGCLENCKIPVLMTLRYVLIFHQCEKTPQVARDHLKVNSTAYPS